MRKRGIQILELKVLISADEIIDAVKKMKKSDREAFVEDLPLGPDNIEKRPGAIANSI